MVFRKENIKKIKQLSSDEKWAYFFENIENNSDQVPEELIGVLSDILASELGVSHEEIDKIYYFISLGFFAHE